MSEGDFPKFIAITSTIQLGKSTKKHIFVVIFSREVDVKQLERTNDLM